MRVQAVDEDCNEESDRLGSLVKMTWNYARSSFSRAFKCCMPQRMHMSSPEKKAVQIEFDGGDYQALLGPAKSKNLTIKEATREALW